MANTINYADVFYNMLQQKYTEQLKSAGLTTNPERYSFMGAKNIKVPHLVLGGFKDHSRTGGFNRQDLSNEYQTFTLDHDRNVEFFVDSMDMDETNYAITAAKLTATFEEEQVIPETDAYRFSKLYTDWVVNGGTADNTALTPANVLSVFDNMMLALDDNETPDEGRILYVTPHVNTLLKNAMSDMRVQSGFSGNVQRIISLLDNVKIIKVPASRMKTVYDFSDGFAPAVGAQQINMLLVHPRSVLAVDKHQYIKLWAQGTHTVGDGLLFQERKYSGLWVIRERNKGIMANIT